MKEYAPVRTGALRDSIRVLRRGNLEIAVSLIYYALYVELGLLK
jgi:hypothetical protein